MEINRWYVVNEGVGDLSGKMCTPAKSSPFGLPLTHCGGRWICYFPHGPWTAIIYDGETRPATDEEVENLYYALNMDGLADE